MIGRTISKNLNRAPDVWRRVGILWRDNVLKAIPGRGGATEKGVHHTYNEWHLGDNAVHMHFLRKLAIAHPHMRFVHATRPALIPQLVEVVEDLPNVEIVKFSDRNKASINSWKNVGYLTPEGGFFDRSPLKNEWAQFHLTLFAHLAGQMGLKSPFSKVEDLLFDYPAIKKNNVMSKPWSFLVNNSCPGSGQFAAYDGPAYFDPLISALTAAGHSVCCTQSSKTGVPCTAEAGLTITGVGNVSLQAAHIIMIANGPAWPTFNVWNRDTVKFRIICSDKETLGLSQNTVQVKSREEVMALLKERKLL